MGLFKTGARAKAMAIEVALRARVTPAGVLSNQ